MEIITVEDFVDLYERFATEVGGAQQILFGALDQLADGLYIFSFKAIGRPYGQFKVIDRAQQQRVDNLIRHLLFQYRRLERDDSDQLFLDDFGSLADSLLGRNGAVGL